MIPWIVIRIPPDYFTRIKPRRRPKFIWSHPVVQGAVIVIKNAFGLILVAVGIIMLFTPGQGFFTILVGLMLMNFPGKYRLEKWLITRDNVARTINWFRRRAGRKPLEFPGSGETKDDF
ncbi:MAG: PGPGW domain-containing protein [Desulfurivibrionaceae bacterium]